MSGAAPGPGPAGPPWQDAWFEHARPRSTWAWRGMLAEHAAASLRLVDSAAEQAVLEALLDGAGARPAPAPHPLLAAPFVHRSPHGSRFRRPRHPGVWYGAEALRTACAELAYWRWRFVTDSDGLAHTELLSTHTLFRARLDGVAIDLAAEPWSQARAHWTDPLDYAPTQALADAARERGVPWLRYESVRDVPGPGRCAAVFEPDVLRELDAASLVTGLCRASASLVRIVCGGEGWDWRFDTR